MATKFKMAAIYQNMACCYEQLVLLRVKNLLSVRYEFKNDAKHLTAVQQKNYTGSHCLTGCDTCGHIEVL